MTHLINDTYAIELTNLGDQYKSFRVLPPDHVWTVPYLKYSYRSIYHTKRRGSDFYCSEEEPLEAGNWQLICTTKDVTNERLAELFGHAFIGDDYARESQNALLTSKWLDPNKNYVLIKKLP